MQTYSMPTGYGAQPVQTMQAPITSMGGMVQGPMDVTQLQTLQQPVNMGTGPVMQGGAMPTYSLGQAATMFGNPGMMQAGMLADVQGLQQTEPPVDPTAGHMKYCMCEACKEKKSGIKSFKSTIEESPQKPTKGPPTNATCREDLCVAVRESKTNLDGAELEAKTAENTLDVYTKNLEALKLNALRAERKTENAMDTVAELKEKHSKVVDIVPSSDPERIMLEQQLGQAQTQAKAALEEAGDVATKLQAEAKDLKTHKEALTSAKARASTAYSEWTMAVCKAAAACSNCNWFEELETSLKAKCSYVCPKCGFQGDFYDIDKHTAACSGDKSKIYHCSNGCGFCGEFEVVERHEQTTCPVRAGARAPVAVSSRAVTGAPVSSAAVTGVSGMYSSKTMPVTSAVSSGGPMYTSATNVPVGATNVPVGASNIASVPGNIPGTNLPIGAVRIDKNKEI